MRTTLFVLLCAFLSARSAGAQSLEQRLMAEGADALAQAALEQGDAGRGAIVFHQPHMACNKCHSVGDKANPLGPELTRLPDDATDRQLVESVLEPSRLIRRGYEPVTLLLNDGRTLTGLVAEERDDALVIRDPSANGEPIVIPLDEIEERTPGETSIMPAGQVNQLASRQQFLDLVKYLIAIRDGGATRALELQPPASLIALRIPEYEEHIDHAGMIADLDQAAFQRGEAIYNRLCINCHGTREAPGSLPTSLRFAEGKFKNGSDPYTMYQTLTRGFGLMAPQTWMVPQQKYDVIHYIREAYLRRHNESQLFEITGSYLASLPAGDTRGPEPTNIEPWVVMDYGPSLINTYEVGRDGGNFAYKGIAVRLDPGPGGVSRGRAWMIFDHDSMRMAAAWTAAEDGPPFIDWSGIHFNGQHQVHPHVSGDVQIANPTGPGWADPGSGSFADDQRVIGRDDRRYGPLPRDWARYRGLYHLGQQVVIAYDIGDAEILERPGMLAPDVALPGVASSETSESTDSAAPTVFTRTFQIGPRTMKLTLQVAHDDADLAFETFASTIGASEQQVAVIGPVPSAAPEPVRHEITFDGATQLQTDAADFDMTGSDFTITARIRTRAGGTIFSRTHPGQEWVHDGKALFVRGGRLCYDIGWVGVVQTRTRVDDNQWHDVALTWEHDSARVRLYVDGRVGGEGELRPKARAGDHVVRVGFAAPNFPKPSHFDGEVAEVRFYARALPDTEVASETSDDRLIARWTMSSDDNRTVPDQTGRGHDLTIGRGAPAAAPRQLAVGLTPPVDGAEFLWESGDLRLRLPAGRDPLEFTLWMAAIEPETDARGFVDTLHVSEMDADLASLTHGGPARWPQVLKTTPVIGPDDGPFAVDVLTHPLDNPWLAQMRFTGFDFFDGGDRMAVCTWDGDVWLVSGLNSLPAAGSDGSAGAELTWQRIASGLFQPLGLKIVRGDIYLTCRDQLAILRDLNGDGETDFYECFNNDQQVTDHFHEFAMGLQVDEQGNFYYAKSARHALPAVVPHHGTLLRVSPDGLRTNIVANGFRAANGVCLNPDGTFIVTDQEGHWNPKNRINWVHEGGFYGNMLGYHDVTDSSDDAMEQPLCWITNAFDRSPAELLWTDSPKWGPLDGALLNLSYGYGQVYVVPHEEIDGQMQGGMCALPIPRLPTGLIRGRFNPIDRQLYTCGMFAWAGSQTQPGGFYRIRATGRPAHLPIGLHATPDGMTIEFSDPLDAESAADPENYAVKVWSLRRTANYGSDHYNEHEIKISAAAVSPDGRTVHLTIPEIAPTWCMEIRCSLRSPDGERVNRVIHNTIHALASSK